MFDEKLLFVVSGPSGVGKDTVISCMRRMHPELQKTISATTRDPRGNEVNDVDYHFYTKAYFEQLLREDALLESNCYNGCYYGTLRSEVEQHTQKGCPVLLVIDVHGGQNIKKLYPDATTVFICPPSLEELERRLRGRGTEDEEKIQKRLKEAKNEIIASEAYDFKVVNDVPETCAEAIYAIIQSRK